MTQLGGFNQQLKKCLKQKLFVMRRIGKSMIWRSEAGCLVQRHRKPLESWHGSNDPGITVFCLSCCSLTFAQMLKGFEGSAELSSQTFTLFFLSFTKGKVGVGLCR